MKDLITIKINRSFQKLKAQLSSINALIVIFMSMSMICMLLFMNCSLVGESERGSTNQTPETGIITTTTTLYTNSNPIVGTPILQPGSGGIWWFWQSAIWW